MDIAGKRCFEDMDVIVEAQVGGKLYVKRFRADAATKTYRRKSTREYEALRKAAGLLDGKDAEAAGKK